MNSIILVFCLLLLIILVKNDDDSTEKLEKCEENIYEKCLHRTNFTAAELEQIRLYLIKRFTEDASLKPPLKAPCEQIYIRKDFKCMTEDERMRFINVVRDLYLDGTIYRQTDIHSRYWAAAHKAAEALIWHRKFLHDFDSILDERSPGMRCPYWDTGTPFSEPWKDMIWRYFGKCGNHFNSYAVTDGPLYKDLNLMIKVNRQWVYDKNQSDCRLNAWDGPEIHTSFLQLFDKLNLLPIGGFHFIVHLTCGGYMGTMSTDIAPNDIIFYLFHLYMDVLIIKLQICNNQYLTPLFYNIYPYLDQQTGLTRGARIETDVLTYYRNTTVLETFQIGFGQFCTIGDRTAEDILDLINNKKKPVPEAIKRLPKLLKLKYFPKFYHDNYTVCDHILLDVGNCNTECKKVPEFLGYFDDENGMRQMRRFFYDENLNVGEIFRLGHLHNQEMVRQFNKYKYCSPYVT